MLHKGLSAHAMKLPIWWAVTQREAAATWRRRFQLLGHLVSSRSFLGASTRTATGEATRP